MHACVLLQAVHVQSSGKVLPKSGGRNVPCPNQTHREMPRMLCPKRSIILPTVTSHRQARHHPKTKSTKYVWHEVAHKVSQHLMSILLSEQ